jgi:hypothetical protein
MACDRFSDAIRGHALGSPLAADAAAHLAVCSTCQARFDTEARVMATIGAALEEITTTAPSANFPSRVRAHVESARRRPVTGGWWVPVTVAALALLVAATVMYRPVDRSVAREASRSQPIAGAAVAPAETIGDGIGDHAGVEAKRIARRRRRAVPEPPRGAHTPEILVPEQRREAVSRLFASLRAGRPEVVSMLMNLHGGEGVSQAAGLTIEPLRIEPVVVSTLPSSAPILDK